MTPRDPDWREGEASALAAENLSYLDLEGPALVMLDNRPEVPKALEALRISSLRWLRRAREGADASPWPPDGPFGAALLRLPKAKAEQEMALHLGLARLRPGGRLVVYGANDEGARSVEGLLKPLAGGTHTVARGGRCRVLTATRPEETGGLRGDPGDWRLDGQPPAPELSGSWVSYPGVFAHGRLDPGTALLLDHLPDVPPGGRVLDFGCGSGVVGAVVLARSRRGGGEPSAVDFLDVDALALRAVEENVPGAEVLLGDGLSPAEGRRYRAVVSNPPYHRGKAESVRVVRELARGAPGVLEPGGALVLVAQRRLPVEGLLEASFSRVRILADGGPYRVWRAVRG